MQAVRMLFTPMVNYARRLLNAIACVGLTLIFSCTTPAQHLGSEDDTALRGRAVKIVDGDTFDLLLENGKRTVRIRLHGIDCPERGQAFYKAAKENLGVLMQDHTLRVVAVDSDRYHRVVGEVFAEKGEWINLQQVAAGMAWHYSRYSADERLADAQREARAARRGLWSMPDPIAPWELRSQQRRGAKEKKQKEVSTKD